MAASIHFDMFIDTSASHLSWVSLEPNSGLLLALYQASLGIMVHHGCHLAWTEECLRRLVRQMGRGELSDSKTHICLSLKVLSERILNKGFSIPECGQHHPLGWGPSWNKK